ncbi:heparan-alpha-glucosaminide N-acetyltransferase domain-containing protein [Saccharopolyspora taberi]|uniref:Heparan-alpha-glucosaminide N-acetyltransferase domain-containing protein n=1 Tax=Saccharopolyspora taberi TaxID=60895 RepID=A0ABN3VLI6_9PSEU
MTSTSLPAPRTGKPPAERKRRLIGIDIARFVAVFGMFNIHFGVPFVEGHPEIVVAEISSGRSTALFTFLAGVSLAMLSGRDVPPTGAALRDARLRIAVRAGLLLVFGVALAKATEATGFLLTVIIAFYGLYFLLAVPFVRMSARGLGISAVVAALVGPQLSFLLRTWMAHDDVARGVVDAVNAVDPGHLIAELGLFDLLLLGFYPAASYLSLVLAGMAVGRLDLRSPKVRLWLAGSGLVLACASYWGSDGLVAAVGGLPDLSAQGTVPIEHPDWLLAHTPHSGTTFELLGSLGVVLVILPACLELAERAGRWLSPLAKAGSMALTLYALHAGVMAWQIVVGGWPLSGVPDFLAKLASMGPALPHDIPDLPAFPPDGHRPEGFVAFLNIYMAELFLAFSILFALVWRRYFARGPLEAAVSEGVRWIVAKINRRPVTSAAGTSAVGTSAAVTSAAVTSAAGAGRVDAGQRRRTGSPDAARSPSR